MPQFGFKTFLQHSQDYRITNLQVVPPILVMMNKRPETTQYELSHVRQVLCGGAPLSPELQQTSTKKFGMAVKQGWGMTELVSGALLQTTADEQSCVGQLIPNCECRLVDKDGNDVGLNVPGEIRIRGPNVCMGYFNNDVATKETITNDGWLRSGDIAVVDENGVFTIIDRKKDLIKVNALQVAPAELEAVMLENNNAADAAVVGIALQDEEWPRTYVVLADHAKREISGRELQSWVAARVATHKWLAGGVALVVEVPRLASGKIQRKVVREWAKRDAKTLEHERSQDLQPKL